MPEPAPSLAAIATPRIEYQDPGAARLPAALLGAVRFGSSTCAADDPRCVRVGLKPLFGEGLVELWRSSGRTHVGFAGPIRFCADEHHCLGAIELDERDFGGLTGAAHTAYASLQQFLAASPHPVPLRIWNYFEGINRGAGDEERYRLFCAGRAAGLGKYDAPTYPAATAIGRRDGDPRLQVYWLAGRLPGVALENPRQLSAYHYPRRYGPAPPSFSRAMLVNERLLMVSGTASIIGHLSHHAGDVTAQLDELLVNLTSILQRAHALAPMLPPRLGATSLLKFYLRDAEALDAVKSLLDERLPPGTPYMILEADICRSELLIEADCVHGMC